MKKKTKSKIVNSKSATSVPVHCSHQKMVAIGELKPNPENPNTHPSAQVDKLAAIIKAHGWRHPITVSKRSGFIVSGHCRRAAAEKLGLKTCPVDYQDFKSKAEERAVLVADNVIGEFSETDVEKMSDIIAALEKSKYNLELTALTAEQIDEYLRGPTGPDPADDIVPDPPKIPKTKTGDLYVLGNHRLLCGDSTKAEDVERLMGKEKADMVFTDPPYGVDIVPKAGWSKGKIGASNLAKCKVYNPIVGDDKQFNPEYLLSLAHNQIIFGGNYFADKMPSSPCWIVWDKREGMTSNSFADCELAWTSFDKPARLYHHLWSGMIRKGDRNIEGKERSHPTQKPVGLFSEILKDFTNEGNLVLDPFLGSGTTIIAAEKLGRRCFGMEIDPIYCDVIVKRYIDYCGKNKDVFLMRDGKEKLCL